MRAQIAENQSNPFDAAVPGQSLTDTPGNSAWEHPPQFTDIQKASKFIWDKLTEPKMVEQVISMLHAGVPVEAIGRTILFGGFFQGKWNPDVALMIAEPVFSMLLAIGIKAKVKKMRVSMEDMTNNKFHRNMAELSDAKKEIEKLTKKVTKDISPQGHGLMAKQAPKEE